MPAIQFTPFFFGGKPSIQYMTGSSIDFNMTLRNYGIVGVKKFGNVDEAKAHFGVKKLQDIMIQINPPYEGGKGRADYFIDKFNAMQRRPMYE